MPNTDTLNTDTSTDNETTFDTEQSLDADSMEPITGEAPELTALTLVRTLPVVSQSCPKVSAPALRRTAAALIDRLLPLPFLSAVFWPWALVVLAYDLLRDYRGASVGKRLLGLETVMASPDPALDGLPCNVGRSLLRNLFWAGARLCYLSVLLSPAGFALDVSACLLVWLSPGGAHLGDRVGGTRVVVADRGNTGGSQQGGF